MTKQRICKYLHCGHALYALGLCLAHYRQHGDAAVLAVTRTIQGQVETFARRVDSKQEAVKAVLQDVAESGPDAVACLVDGSLTTVEQLRGAD